MSLNPNPIAVALAELFSSGVTELVELAHDALRGAYTAGLTPAQIMNQLTAGLSELQGKLATQAVELASNNAAADAVAAAKPAAAPPATAPATAPAPAPAPEGGS